MAVLLPRGISRNLAGRRPGCSVIYSRRPDHWPNRRLRVAGPARSSLGLVVSMLDQHLAVFGRPSAGWSDTGHRSSSNAFGTWRPGVSSLPVAWKAAGPAVSFGRVENAVAHDASTAKHLEIVPLGRARPGSTVPSVSCYFAASERARHAAYSSHPQQFESLVRLSCRP